MEIIVTTHCPDMERFIHMSYSMLSLFDTIDDSTRVIIYDNSAMPTSDCLTDEAGRSMSALFFSSLSRRHKFAYRPMEYNRGMVFPKNDALLHCKSDTIIFTDNDIYYRIEWLHEIKKALERGTLVSPLAANNKYFVQNYPNAKQYTKVSPGVFAIHKDECPIWEDVNIPGRIFLRDAKRNGLIFLTTFNPTAIHVGAGQTTWHEN